LALALAVGQTLPRAARASRSRAEGRSTDTCRRGAESLSSLAQKLGEEISAAAVKDAAAADTIRELIDAYAHCADRRDADGQKSLFTDDTHFVVYMDGEGSDPTQELDGREALTPVLADLNRYQATTHFNGQSTVALEGDRATGESYCLAHHLFTEGGERKLMVASLRYLDTFHKSDGAWLFAERRLYVDWTETRPSQTQT
jgi:ketosteroid isomerase-like protein